MSKPWRTSLSKLVTDRLGIELRERQLSDDVERFVTQRAAATGVGSPDAYIEHLRRQAVDAPEFSELVRVITVAHSFFFRDNEQLDAALNALRRTQTGGSRMMWSACCSTGQEAYSMVMLALESGVDLRVMATDINPDVIRVAREGVYTAWAMRSVDKKRRERFFEPVGDGSYRLAKKIRDRVHFEVRNLLDGPPSRAPASGFDVVLCRNAFIYFTPEARADASRRIARALARQGWLFLGASETLRGLSNVPLKPDMRWGRVAWTHGTSEVLQAPPLTSKRAKAPPALIPREPARAVREAPSTPRGDAIAALQRGHAALQKHAFDDALQAYSEAQALNPLLAEVHFCEGVVHRKGSDLAQAAAAFRRALFLDPDFWPASFLLAGVYRRQDQLRRAARQLRDTLRSIDVKRNTSLFRSKVTGIESLDLDADQVRSACTRMLS